jgi:hypothetical protein
MQVTTGPTLTSARGVAFDIQAGGFMAGQLIQEPNNAFDGSNRLQVGGTDFSPPFGPAVMGNGGRTLLVRTQTLAGLNVHREITVPNTGNFAGIELLDAWVETTGTGNVLVKGRGGADGTTSEHYGIAVWSDSSGSSIAAWGTGKVTLVGTGGAGVEKNAGVWLDSGGVAAFTLGGDLSITGDAGDGSGPYNVGVWVDGGPLQPATWRSQALAAPVRRTALACG